MKILSAINQENLDQLEAMADELCREYIAQNDTLANKNDLTALFRIGYGLYVVTSNDGKKDNGLIVNTVIQLTDTPEPCGSQHQQKPTTHTHVIKQTGVLNVNCLSTEAPFSVFQQFGFQTGRSVDKFAGQTVHRSDNGLVFLDKYINAFMSLKVEDYVDLGTHGMFICSVTEARVMSNQETMTYTYYQNNVKPKTGKPKERKDLSAKSAAISTRVMNFRQTTSARFANTELLILSRSNKITKIRSYRVFIPNMIHSRK